MPVYTHIPLRSIFPVLESKPKKRMLYKFNCNWLVLVLVNSSQYQAVAVFCEQKDAEDFKRLLKKRSRKERKMRTINGPGS